ncbi:hypothetical protein HRbin40_00120 [bacterium HR40]|nr:hypothetical protein HRbin40_00120 [bacterium HR40]
MVSPSGRWLEAWRVYTDPRVLAIFALGFSSGLPIMLVATTLATWLAEEGVSKASIGLFAYVFAPYTFKFAWAPLVDRMPLPPFTTLLGRRRGWLLASQLALLVSIWALGQSDPASDLYRTAVCALLVAFFSASQDIVVDAFRIEILPEAKLGAGAGVVVLGYRIGMWVATAGALLLAEAAGWSTAYTAMALLVFVGIGTVLLVPEPEASPTVGARSERMRRADEAVGRDSGIGDGRACPFGIMPRFALLGLLLLEPVSLLFALAFGLHSPLTGGLDILLVAAEVGLAVLGIGAGRALLARSARAPRLLLDWALSSLLLAILQVPLWAFLAEGPYLAESYAWLVLRAAHLLADSLARLAGGSLDPSLFSSPLWLVAVSFWLRFAFAVFLYGLVHFDRSMAAIFGPLSPHRVARVHLWVRQAVVEPFHDFFHRHGVAVAGAILALISLYKASDAMLTLMANPFYIDMGFSKAQIAWVGKTFGLWMTLLGGLLGGAVVYRLGLIRSLALGVVAMAASNLAFLLLAWSPHPPAADQEMGADLWRLALFHLVILVENLSGGLGTTVFVAYLSSLCNAHYTAVQYALLTSFMQLFGKFVLVPSSGFFVEALGWPAFFVTSSLFALPSLFLIAWLQRRGMGAEGSQAIVDGFRGP